MVVGFPDPPTPYYPTHLLANSTHKDFGRILRATHSAYVREKYTTIPISGPDAIGDMPQTPRGRASSDVFVCQKMN